MRTRARIFVERGGRLASLGLLLACSTALAYRPFNQTDADTAEKGVIELEVGPADFEHSHEGFVYEPSFVFNYGFLDGWEAVLDTDVGPADAAAQVTQAWQSELGLLVKHVLRRGCLQGGSGPSVALEAGLLVPSLPRSGDFFGASLAGMVSQKWNALTVHVNAMLDLTRTEALDTVVGFIVEGPDRWAARPVAEFYFEAQQHLAPTYSGLVGFLWPLRPDFVLDGGLRFASESGVPVQELRLGFTWAIAVAKPK